MQDDYELPSTSTYERLDNSNDPAYLPYTTLADTGHGKTPTPTSTSASGPREQGRTEPLRYVRNTELPGDTSSQRDSNENKRGKVYGIVLVLFAFGIVCLVVWNVYLTMAINELDAKGKIFEKTTTSSISDQTGNTLPRDCSGLHIPTPVNGTHIIFPFNVLNKPVAVYCEFDSENHVWTVFQRRFDGSVDFQQNWTAYKSGFGSPAGEYWLGNDVIHELTSYGGVKYSLKIVMSDFNDTVKYAEYKHFKIENEARLYRITVYGYNGTAGDSFSETSSCNFSTIDQDNDAHKDVHCAMLYRGAWWHHGCLKSNLNGLYLKGPHKSFSKGMVWNAWHGMYYSMKTTAMMISSA